LANIINGTDTGSGGLITTGDSSDELQLQTAETARVTLTNTAVVVNEGGDDVDFRVEGDTDANLLVVDAGEDAVVVGAASPVDVYITGASVVSPRFQIYGTSAADSTLSLIRSDNSPYLAFSNGSSGNNVVDSSVMGRIVASGYDGANYRVGVDIKFEVDGTPGTGDMPGRINFATSSSGTASPTNRMQITSDGYVRLSSASLGIQFGGDTAAANALDDYEEGTWTPVVADAASGGNESATTPTSAIYTKIGRLVTVQCFFTNVSTAGLTAGNDIHITGLPFTAASVSGTTLVPGGSIIVQQTTFSGYLVPYVFDNQSYMRIAEVASGSVADALLVSEITSGTTDIWLSLTYQAA